MPSFNQVKYIEHSILSILAQEYSNVQLIVVDGGSTDGTLGILKKYSNYIDILISEDDKGQSDALNKGFSLADGEIFGWLNSVDLYLPHAFTRVVDAFKYNNQKQIVFGDWLSVDAYDRTIDYNHAFDFSLNHLSMRVSFECTGYVLA